MPKMTLELDFVGKTEKFLITNKESFETEIICGDLAKKYYSKVDPAKLSLFMRTYDPNDEYSGISFEFPIKAAKKNSIFSIEPSDDYSGLKVTVKGTLELALRAGVKESITPSQKLKVQGIAYIGGSYKGFMSYLAGQSDENIGDWLEVVNYKVT